MIMSHDILCESVVIHALLFVVQIPEQSQSWEHWFTCLNVNSQIIYYFNNVLSSELFDNQTYYIAFNCF